VNRTSKQVLIDEDLLRSLANQASFSPESLSQGAMVPKQTSVPSEYFVPDDSLGPQIDVNNERNVVPSGTFG